MDYFEYGLDPGSPATVGGFDAERFLKRSQQREKDRLEDELERIADQLDGRDELHAEAVDFLESKLEWYTDQLEDTYQRTFGTGSDIPELKARIREFYRELREERRQHWLDKQNLESERRSLLRELAEIEDDSLARIDSLDEIHW